MSRPTNYRATVRTGDRSGSTTLAELRTSDMAALAALPPSIRHSLNELALKLSAEAVLAYYQSIARQAAGRGGSPFDAEIHTLRKLSAIEADDLDAFAAIWRARWHCEYPHTAALVPVLRYGPLEPGGRRHAPTRGLQLIEGVAA